MPAPQAPGSMGRAGRGLLGLGIVLISFNLRPIFSSLSAVLPDAIHEFDLSPAFASLVTTLPVAALGLFAPLAPILARRFGIERVLLGLLVVLGVGTSLRGAGAPWTLLIGSILAGGAISIGNVLMPSLIKRDFPDRVALMTGLFTMALCGGAALAAGVTAPMAVRFGSWHSALAIWAAPAVVAALVWLPQVLQSGRAEFRPRSKLGGIWRDPLAWQVTLFMGLQSAFAYSVFGWLAPILRWRGLSGIEAGFVVSMSVLVQTASCLLAPAVALRGRDQRIVNATLVAFALVGLLGCLYAPLWSVWGWAVLQGIGQGSLIAVAMTVIVLRSRTPDIAAQLSSMAQTVGYLLAATGPLIVGLLAGISGSFTVTGAYFVLLGIAAAAAGIGAGRARYVLPHLVADKETAA
ncbi:MFS transporter [Oryzibacter oryziterrae]|uniref:MFS transporter n=1 Tax=Oryzibacter oryziterrae TaxID=2766474 RepID=UPI001F0029F5|nr:MFS transporter [Oryzibacter oryziterrae]